MRPGADAPGVEPTVVVVDAGTVDVVVVPGDRPGVLLGAVEGAVLRDVVVERATGAPVVVVRRVGNDGAGCREALGGSVTAVST